MDERGADRRAADRAGAGARLRVLGDSGAVDSGSPVPVDDRVLAAARRLAAEAERRDGAPPISDQALIELAQGKRRAVLFAEVDGIADAGDAEPVAAAVLSPREIDLVVRPAARGRGIGSAALAHALDLAARAAGTSRADLDGLRAWSHGSAAADAMLAAAGFAPVRELLRMALAPSLLPSAESGLPEPPAGTALVSGALGPREGEAWVRVNAAAFAAHPEQGSMTLEDFAALTREPWFSPDDLLRLYRAEPEGAGGGADSAPSAEPGDPAPEELLGTTWIKTVPATGSEPRGGSPAVECELYAIGVLPETAGRGYGRFLLDATLARMAQHAPERVTLYVDGDNERAVDMYRASGFEVELRSRQWQLG